MLVVQYGGRTYVEEPKTVTGEMELFNAKNKGNDNKNYIKVGGEEYKQDGLEVLSNINKDNPVKFLISECDDKPTACSLTLSTTSSWTTSATSWPSVRSRRSHQYALALDSAYSINGLTTTGQIKLLLADGTSKVYDVDMDATADRFEDLANSDDNSTKDSAVETWFGSAITTTTPWTPS